MNMTGKERVAKMHRRQAQEKAKNISLIVLDIVVTIGLIWDGLSSAGRGSLLAVGAGTVLLIFNYLALLWSFPTMLKIQGKFPWFRKLLIKIAGTDQHWNCPRLLFLRGIAISLGLSAATIYLISCIFVQQ